MKKISIVAALGLLFAGLSLVSGCKDSKMPWDKSDKPTTQAATHDDCPMCPGVQTAKADGTCPKCGMTVK